MFASDLKKRLNLQMVIQMVEYLGGEFNPNMETEEKLVMNTHLCHDGDSFKCDLYKDSLYFFCYSCCGSFSIVDLVQNVMHFETLQEAVDFIAEFFNIGNTVRGFGKTVKPIVVNRPIIKKEINFEETLKEYDDYILNTFSNYHAVEWLYEGINDDTMNKYEIMFDMQTEAIILPHRDINDRLVGIRQRNLSEYQTKILKRKYVPYTNYRAKEIYKHKLGYNLYGLNHNKEAIAETQKCILYEAEKSVLKMDSIYNDNPSVAVGGSAVNEYQLNLLKQVGCKDIYVAFDKEESNEKWIKKMKKIYLKIFTFGLRCFIIEDTLGLLEMKDSPIDEGKEVFEKLLGKSREFTIDMI